MKKYLLFVKEILQIEKSVLAIFPHLSVLCYRKCIITKRENFGRNNMWHPLPFHSRARPERAYFEHFGTRCHREKLNGEEKVGSHPPKNRTRVYSPSLLVAQREYDECNWHLALSRRFVQISSASYAFLQWPWRSRWWEPTMRQMYRR